MAFQMFHSFYYPEYMEETDQERQIFARPFAEVLEEGKGARSRRREGEKHFLSYITLGNPALLKQLFEHAFQKNTLFELGQLSENALRQARYMMICHVTLCSRAAIEGGLPETLAYYMSDSYIRYLDGQTDTALLIATRESLHEEIMEDIERYGFVYRKLKEKLRNVHHTGVFIHNDQSAGSHHGTNGDQIIIVDRYVKMLCRDTSAGRASCLRRFEFLAARDTAAESSGRVMRPNLAMLTNYPLPPQYGIMIKTGG